jgi:hypothetical protein
MKIDYFSLLSPSPIFINGVGNIVSPTLRNISNLKYKYNTYQIYISFLLMNIKTYYETIDKNDELYFKDYTEEQKTKVLSVRKEYFSMTEKDRNEVSFFQIMVFDEPLISSIEEALNFFFVERVIFSDEHHAFFTYENTLSDIDLSNPIGIINYQTYPYVADIILQRVCVDTDEIEENVKVKNKMAAKILEKIKKANKEKKVKHDKKMELPNLISALSSHSKNLNIINIWDLTVYQLYDQFRRQQIDDSFSISSARVASWGDSDNKFDNTFWFSLLNDD